MTNEELIELLNSIPIGGGLEIKFHKLRVASGHSHNVHNHLANKLTEQYVSEVCEKIGVRYYVDYRTFTYVFRKIMKVEVVNLDGEIEMRDISEIQRWHDRPDEYVPVLKENEDYVVDVTGRIFIVDK